MSKTILLAVLGAASGCALGAGDPADHTQEVSSDEHGACLESPHVAKVKAVVYNPTFASTGTSLREAMQWPNDPDQILPAIAADLTTSSHGLVQYEIISTDHRNEFPPLMDGFRYTEASYRAVTANPASHHTPEGADYAYVVNQLGGCAALARDHVTEIWVFGFDWAGFDELAMKMPGDQVPPHQNPWFYRPYNIPDCGRTLWVMGFNMAVGEDNAVHSYGHRVESVVSLTVGRGKWFDADDPQNPWRLFSLTDKDYPGRAGVGDVHVPANGAAEYQYDNPRHVTSTAEDWLNYPELTGAARQLDCTAWGCTQLGYQKWYLAHLPHAPGSTPWGCNDWWTYVADYDRNLEPVAGAALPPPLCDLLGAGLSCFGAPTTGAFACRQYESSTSPIYCAPSGPPPLCDALGTGLTCFGSPATGTVPCRQAPSSTTPIYCVP
jgi:hypothetical protein